MQRGRKGIPNKQKLTSCDIPGWLRLVVERSSGASKGKLDFYYLSPENVKFRSKVSLVKHFGSSMDLSCFDFKTGKMMPKPVGVSKRSSKRKRVHNTVNNLPPELALPKTPEIFAGEKKKQSTSFSVDSHHSSTSDRSAAVGEPPTESPKVFTGPSKVVSKSLECKAVEKVDSPKLTSSSSAVIIYPEDVVRAIISTLYLENGFDFYGYLTKDEIVMKLAERIDNNVAVFPPQF